MKVRAREAEAKKAVEERKDTMQRNDSQTVDLDEVHIKCYEDVGPMPTKRWNVDMVVDKKYIIDRWAMPKGHDRRSKLRADLEAEAMKPTDNMHADNVSQVHHIRQRLAEDAKCRHHRGRDDLQARGASSGRKANELNSLLRILNG